MTARWRFARGRSVELDGPKVIAIINVTPDSFSDGGLHLDPAAAAARAAECIAEGAWGLDVGGESTRPGARAVPDDEQIRRTIGVIERVRGQGITAPISIDTTSAAVARAALDAGADIVNDQSAGIADAAMFGLVADRACGVVLMHRASAAAGARWSTDEQGGAGTVEAVRTFLAERSRAAQAAGVGPDAIVIDPGLGFGKSVRENFALVARAGELLALGYPVLCAASRKSFLGAATGVESPTGRVASSVAVAVRQYLAGVRLFRVHDVGEHVQALRTAAAVCAEVVGE